MKVTLKDVANASGVSIATVSYILNNKQSMLKLSPATVQRVLSVSQELQYRPDMIAKALEAQKRLVLSVVIFSPWLYSQFSDFMAQVNLAVKTIQDEGKLAVDYKHYPSGQLKRHLSPGKYKKYDAVIVIGTSEEDDIFLEKISQSLPNVILLNRIWNGCRYSCANDEECCTVLAERLIIRGHYDKYVLSYRPQRSRREDFRINGYTKILSSLGNRRFQRHEINYTDRGNDCFHEMLDLYGKERVCYIFTQYFPAARFLNFAVRHQIQIPEEIGVIGYDKHSLLDDFMVPQLTTIDPKIKQMTLNALEMARNLKHGAKCENKIIDAAIDLGNSVIL